MCVCWCMCEGIWISHTSIFWYCAATRHATNQVSSSERWAKAGASGRCGGACNWKRKELNCVDVAINSAIAFQSIAFSPAAATHCFSFWRFFFSSSALYYCCKFQFVTLVFVLFFHISGKLVGFLWCQRRFCVDFHFAVSFHPNGHVIEGMAREQT